MDLTVSFLSMLLLMFGLSMVGLGVFTTYFGAGKSRIIGVLLLLIGITILAIFYIMATDYTGYDWEMEDISDSFLGVIGIGLGAGAAFGLVIGLMMVIKEQEPDIPGLDDWEKEMGSKQTKGPQTEEPLPEGGDVATPAPETVPEVSEPEPGEESGEEIEPPAPEDIPTTPVGGGIENVGSDNGSDDPPSPPETDADEDMTEFLKDKEEKKLVTEEWEKVDPEGSPEAEPTEEEPSEEEPSSEEKTTAEAEEEPSGDAIVDSPIGDTPSGDAPATGSEDEPDDQSSENVNVNEEPPAPEDQIDEPGPADEDEIEKKEVD